MSKDRGCNEPEGRPVVTRRNLLAAGAGSALAVGLLPAAGLSQEESANGFFVAGLTGEQEVPSVDTEAQGGAMLGFNEDGTQLSYALTTNAIEDVTQAHVHQGSVGENGPVVAWLYPAPEVQSEQLIEGRFDGVLASDIVTESDLTGPLEGEPVSALADEIAAGNTYVNVHTTANPAGEIRGQTLALGDLVEMVEDWQPSGATETETAQETATEAPGTVTDTAETETPERTTTTSQY